MDEKFLIRNREKYVGFIYYMISKTDTYIFIKKTYIKNAMLQVAMKTSSLINKNIIQIVVTSMKVRMKSEDTRNVNLIHMNVLKTKVT